MPVVVGGGGLHFTRPESAPRTHGRAGSPTPRTAERREGPHRFRAAHPFAPVLHATRRSPAGPKHQQRQHQSVAGRERIHGPRMLMNGETFFHVPTPTHQRA